MVGGFSGPPSHYTQILWVFLEDKWCGSGRNKAASSWLGLEAQEDPSDQTSTAAVVCVCYSSSGGGYGLFTMRDRASGVGDFIVRGYLQQNPRKQERTEALQSSLCSHRGAATSLHQKLQTQSLGSSGTASWRGCCCQHLTVSWSPSHRVWNEGKKVSRFQSVVGLGLVYSWDGGELQ